MRKNSIAATWLALSAVALLTSACGKSAVAPGAREATAATPPAPASMDAPSAVAEAPAPRPSLPAAPWADAPLAQRDVPPALLAAWRRAENRAWCAPVAPRSLGTGAGARPRRGTMVDRGWSVEFDRPGAPGLAADGSACPRCGRGTFGIVGAALTPEETFDVESTPAAFRDGSRLAVERPAAEGEPAAATLEIAGQGCVYQVWSFLGEEHLRGLVDELRFVETGRETVAMDE